MPDPAFHRTGILGGSFDPVHHGHLLMAGDALEIFSLERVLFLPCAVPPHKPGRRLAPAADRVAMLAAAMDGEPRFEICDLELQRGGVCYTIDTLDALRRRRGVDRFFFIIGDDSLADLPHWRRIDDLLTACDFVTLARPGCRPPAALAVLAPEQRERLLAHRRIGHSLNVSSSDIRDRVATGRSIRYLVPDAVADHIARQGLYRSAPRDAGAPAHANHPNPPAPHQGRPSR